MRASLALLPLFTALVAACGGHGVHERSQIEAEIAQSCEGSNPPVWCPMKCQNCGGQYCINGYKAWMCNVDPRQGDLCPGGCDDCPRRREYDAPRGCVGGPTGADGVVCNPC